jgi:outer membrane protein assembly factor BamB
VLFGGADANVHAIGTEGKLLWQFNTGDEVTALACRDVDGDGADEVIVGSLSFNVYAVKGDGTLLWRQDLGWPVSDLCVVGEGNDAVVCAVTHEGRVCVLNGADGAWIGALALEADGLRVASIPQPVDGSPTIVATSTDGNLFGLTW